jgi:hypothetical protein
MLEIPIPSKSVDNAVGSTLFTEKFEFVFQILPSGVMRRAICPGEKEPVIYITE